MSISGSARLAGVVGWPVTQSLSPRLHGYWLRELGIDGAYLPLGVQPEDLSRALLGLRLTGFRGVNLTVPHKEAAFALANRCDRAATVTGAVNLLTFDDRGLTGRNTDTSGIVACLTEALGREAVKGRPVAILGAGGTARAAVYALSEMGAAEIRILNRTKSRAETLAASLAPSVSASLTGLGFERWAEAAKDVALLVHTTSAGMKGAPAIDLPLEILPAHAAVFDVVYNPLETALLARAKARGLRTVDGLGMLMHQAVPAFEAFYGVAPRVTPELRKTLEEALSRG